MTFLVTLAGALDAVLDRIRSLCVFATGIAMVVLVTIFAWLVFGRYVLNETPTWVEQLALVLVCYIAFIGAAVGVRDETHLGVTFLRDALPPKPRKVLRIIGELALAGFGLVMLLSCIELVIFGWDTLLPMLDAPEGVRTLPAAICGGLVFAFSSARAIRLIYSFVDAPGPGDAEGGADGAPLIKGG
ncbi:MAG: TRAP transporter small permease [Pseudomonadota bacterium]